MDLIILKQHLDVHSGVLPDYFIPRNYFTMMSFKLSTRIRQVIYKVPVIFLLGDSSTQGIFTEKI